MGRLGHRNGASLDMKWYINYQIMMCCSEAEALNVLTSTVFMIAPFQSCQNNSQRQDSALVLGWNHLHLGSISQNGSSPSAANLVFNVAYDKSENWQCGKVGSHAPNNETRALFHIRHRSQLTIDIRLHWNTWHHKIFGKDYKQKQIDASLSGGFGDLMPTVREKNRKINQ